MATTEMNYVEGGGSSESEMNTIGTKPTYNQFENIGYFPQKIVIADVNYNSGKRVDIYDRDWNESKTRYYYNNNAVAEGTIDSNYLITNIDSNGFTLNSTYLSSYASDKMVVLVSPV